MRINIAVHGRFHAFDLAAATLRLGHDVELLTNYPRYVVRRWQFPAERTRSFVLHGIAARLAQRVAPRSVVFESLLKKEFGRWVRNQMRDDVDVLSCFSGVAEEAFCVTRAIKMLVRSSAHIRAQSEILLTEQARSGVRLEQPSPWIIEREEREYELADYIVVPSEFARRSFVGRRAAERVKVVPLTADAVRWRPSEATVEERCQRIERGDRLRLLYVGAVGYQKGLYDLGQMVDQLGERVELRMVGRVSEEAASWVQKYADRVRIDGHVPEETLRDAYRWADVFIFPTIQDGYGVVLSQAQASAVPFIATENCGAPDLLKFGGRGWLVPAQNPDALACQVVWCDEHREDVLAAVRDLQRAPPTRSWEDVAGDEINIALAFAR